MLLLSYTNEELEEIAVELEITKLIGDMGVAGLAGVSHLLAIASSSEPFKGRVFPKVSAFECFFFTFNLI